MSPFLKVMVALLLTLPLGGYVAGTLASSPADAPPAPVPVVLEGNPSHGAETAPGDPQPSASSSPGQERGDGDPGRDDGDDDGDDDGGVRVIRPTPHDVDDHGGHTPGDDDGGDDNSGHGSDGAGGDDADGADDD